MNAYSLAEAGCFPPKKTGLNELNLQKYVQLAVGSEGKVAV